jgi:hypothetical protein
MGSVDSTNAILICVNQKLALSTYINGFVT